MREFPSLFVGELKMRAYPVGAEATTGWLELRVGLLSIIGTAAQFGGD